MNAAEEEPDAELEEAARNMAELLELEPLGEAGEDAMDLDEPRAPPPLSRAEQAQAAANHVEDVLAAAFAVEEQRFRTVPDLVRARDEEIVEARPVVETIVAELESCRDELSAYTEEVRRRQGFAPNLAQRQELGLLQQLAARISRATGEARARLDTLEANTAKFVEQAILYHFRAGFQDTPFPTRNELDDEVAALLTDNPALPRNKVELPVLGTAARLQGHFVL